jgi:zinc D-Ala-D-Ala dipeptidase
VVLALLIGSCVPAGADGRDRPTDLVELTSVIPDAVIDMRYATKDNFTGEQLYPVARCKLRRAVAARLAKAATLLRAQDRRLLVWDCYRPRSIQDVLWKLVPDERYVANPKVGSRHKTALQGDAGREARRLESAMKKAGFVAMPTEWWHFDAPDATKYALSDEPL